MIRAKQNNERKIKTSVAFSPEINTLLKFVATQEQRSMRSIIDIVISEYLQAYIKSHIEKYGEEDVQDPEELLRIAHKQEKKFLSKQLKKTKTKVTKAGKNAASVIIEIKKEEEERMRKAQELVEELNASNLVDN